MSAAGNSVSTDLSELRQRMPLYVSAAARDIAREIIADMDGERHDGGVYAVARWVDAMMPQFVSGAQGSPDRDKLAETIHDARWPTDRQLSILPFADEDRNGREYCYRIADAILNSGAPMASQGAGANTNATQPAGSLNFSQPVPAGDKGEAVAWRWRSTFDPNHVGWWEFKETKPDIPADLPHDCEPLFAAPQPARDAYDAGNCGAWRDIKTAPNHGEILLWWKYAGVGVGSWNDEGNGWRCEGDECVPKNQSDCTHWMPMPPAPLDAIDTRRERGEMSKKHIATYPLYGTFPISGRVNTSNRVGTGYIYSPAEIDALEQRLESRGHPLRIRWRNEKCRVAAVTSTQSGGAAK